MLIIIIAQAQDFCDSVHFMNNLGERWDTLYLTAKNRGPSDDDRGDELLRL